jgi:hypothetical protein
VVSDQFVTIEFSVTFTDGCLSTTLDPPVFNSSPPYELLTFEEELLNFEPAVSSRPDCGPISYDLVDADTGETLPTDQFTVSFEPSDNPTELHITPIDLSIAG